MTDDIRFERQGALGCVTLNRPAALHALTGPMVAAMSRQLTRWASDDTIAAVLVQAAPARAFCAGGDVRFVRESVLAGRAPLADSFFAEEYRLNWRIHRYPKPYVVVMDGLTLGGGVGISAHGGVRIVTEATQLAMPETAIGMVTDVGATWLLSHLPAGSGAVGIYLALTGTRLDAAGCLAYGLADQFVGRAELPDLLSTLGRSVQHGGAGIAQAVARHGSVPPSDPLAAERSRIDRHFDQEDIAGICRSLQADTDDWAGQHRALLAERSPLALALTHRLLQQAANLTLDEALRQEYQTVCWLIRQGDFAEGVRAMLVDKDRRPVWQKHPTTDAISSIAIPERSARRPLPLDWQETELFLSTGVCQNVG